ncbi:MAG: FHA domain-containing protein, partial [Armatimonadetes bacterium]|nr:FHA domain-containing protein [Armatimonadota bacterium]
MNSKLKILLEAAAGAAGGFLAWMVMEPCPFLTSDEPRSVASPVDWLSIVLFGAVMGACISALIGAIEGLATGSRRQLRRAVGFGFVIGLAGGMAGLFFGQVVYGRLQAPPSGGAFTVSLLGFLRSVFARALGWAFVGLFIGGAQGVPTASLRKMRHGAVGGFIGGLLGGMLFEFVAAILQVGGAPSRLVSMTITGAAIGFFVGLVQDLLKQAWVVVLRGRNEGREYVLDKPTSILGRDELADVGVFGDPSVAPQHAVIKVAGGRYRIEDLGSAPTGTLVNGQPVSQVGLADGDVITLGATQIKFHEKLGAAPVRKARDVIAQSAARGPALPDNICRFCGEAKDPVSGTCACTPVPPQQPGFTVAAQGAGAAGQTPLATGPASLGPRPVGAATAGARLV